MKILYKILNVFINLHDFSRSRNHTFKMKLSNGSSFFNAVTVKKNILILSWLVLSHFYAILSHLKAIESLLRPPG